MIEKIFIFILFLCPLVFFHELGHFLFARLFGVRVEVFSIGFGPKLLKFKPKTTEYAFSLIPLGGYVKMFGDDPFNEGAISEADRQYSFIHQSKWARFWIVFGGPLANVILAFGIYYSLFLIGERIPEMKFGQVSEKSAIYSAGIRPGDVLTKINGKLLHNPTDLDLGLDQRINEITVKRADIESNYPINISGQEFLNELMAHPPVLRVPVVVDRDGVFYALSKDGKSVDWGYSLDEFSKSENAVVYFLPIIKKGELYKSEVDVSRVKKLELTPSGFWGDLYKNGFFSHDLLVEKTSDQSAAFKAGILANDILVDVNKTPVYAFDSIREIIKDAKGEVELSVLRKGNRLSFKLVPQEVDEEGKRVKIIGVYSAKEYIPLNYVSSPSKGVFGSLKLAAIRTVDVIGKTLDGFKKLLTSRDSFKNIGGPIAIGKVAADSFNTSLSNFFQIMALISINLGIINLFPIPVLDGGHIMFILLEIVNRGPLSRRKMEIAQQFGLSLLLLLMFAAIFNDVTRFF